MDKRNGLHVLLVEDNDEMREMLAESLRRVGHDVTECANGEEWLNHCASIDAEARSHPHDLVVSDVQMPHVGGLEALRALNGIDAAQTPTIFITAAKDRETVERAYALGAAKVLHKPFPIAEFIAAVRECAASAGANESTASRNIQERRTEA